MALAPAARRPRRLRRRPVGGVPAEGRRAVPAVVRLRARPAGAARRGRLRAARAAPRRAQGRPPRRHAGLLRHGGDAGPGAAARRRADRAAGLIVDAASGVSGAGRAANADQRVLHRRRELRRLRPARPPPHAGDRAEPRRPGAVHAAPGADEPGDPGDLLRPAGRPASSVSTAALLAALREAYAAEPFVVVIDGSPSTKATLGSNAAHVTARYDERTGYVVALCAHRQPDQGRLRRRAAVGQRRPRPRRDAPASRSSASLRDASSDGPRARRPRGPRSLALGWHETLGWRSGEPVTSRAHRRPRPRRGAAVHPPLRRQDDRRQVRRQRPRRHVRRTTPSTCSPRTSC